MKSATKPQRGRGSARGGAWVSATALLWLLDVDVEAEGASSVLLHDTLVPPVTGTRDIGPDACADTGPERGPAPPVIEGGGMLRPARFSATWRTRRERPR